MPFISILTDFGTKDGFVGTMKGVIWQICPDAQIADISHEIGAQNIREGAIALWRAAPFFPSGSVHIAVVDPGVGTRRRPMAAQVGVAVRGGSGQWAVHPHDRGCARRRVRGALRGAG